MCDFSLHSVKSRPAKVGDKLTTRDFGTGTRGFAASEDLNVAVCVLPGTELAFAHDVQRLSARVWPWHNRTIEQKTAIFRQINKDKVAAHPRRTGVSRRPDCTPDMFERRSGSYRSPVASGAKDCG